jgi:hypothetical protein
VPVYNSSDEVFRYLREKYGVDGDGDMNAVALFANALIEKDRIDWAQHMATQNGRDPTADEIAGWYRSKPDTYFVDRERLAENWFGGFARTYLHDEIEQGKGNAIRQAIGKLDNFWSQFWMGNLVGITSNFVFALIVVAFVALITTDFSFIAWAKKLFGAHSP